MQLSPGAVLDDRYEVIRRLGEGGTASVWSAIDRKTNTDVAIKVLHAELRPLGKNRMRFEREAHVLASLDHPHIAKLLDHRLDHDMPYFVLELLHGRTLADLIGAHASEGSPIGLEATLGIFSEICAGVAHAHERGILHRDLKPGNVMIEPTKVLDFGLAKLTAAPRDQATTRGRQIGSYFYMAPEQTYGQEATVASDVFGLGCILYEMLTLHRAWAKDAKGKPLRAFAGERAANTYNMPSEIMGRIRRDPRPRPSDIVPELDAFDAVIERALAIDRRERHASVLELLEDARAAADLDDITVRLDEQEVPLRPESGLVTVREPAPRPKKKLPRWAWWIAIAIAGAAASITAWLW